MSSAVQLEQKQKEPKQNRPRINGAFFVGSVTPTVEDYKECQLVYRFEGQEYMVFKIRKNHSLAKVPSFALPGDAGMDLFSIEAKTLKPFQVEQIRTGIEIELPPKTVGLVWDKSGLATKHGITVMGGVFDEIYRGELIVSMINLSSKEYKVKPGEKIAQLLIQKIEHPSIQEVEELSPTVRGEQRLGSTGLS